MVRKENSQRLKFLFLETQKLDTTGVSSLLPRGQDHNHICIQYFLWW